MDIKEYQNQSWDKLYSFLESDPKGLKDEIVQKKLNYYGYNELSKKKRISGVLKFLSYFKNPLVIILLIAGLISGLANEIKNFIIINTMVLMSIVLNFYQEHKSNKAAERISERLAVSVYVRRNGIKKEIPIKFLVPGDIIILSAGNIVPADGRIIECDDFFVNESALTGESFPVEKINETHNNGSDNIVFSGTNVVSGSAEVIVLQTGGKTQYGQIANKLSGPAETNAFDIGIKKFGYLIIQMVLFIVIFIFFINLFKGKELIDTFVFSIAVAVGLTPELLPMIMSVNMAKGSINMAGKGVVVKRLNAIPDFGSMDILCTDKTGTLTEDNITIVKHIDLFGHDSSQVLRLAYINSFFQTGLKSLMDKAIMDFENIDLGGLKKVDEIPYDFNRKRISIIYLENNNRQMVTKGAPEEIFRISKYYYDGLKEQPINDVAKKKFMSIYRDLGNDGFRVLAVATKDVIDDKKVYPKSEEDGMCLIGFVAFYDPPKQNTKETLQFMKEHGVEVKIITGDSHLVAKKICEELNFEIKGIMVADEIGLETMTDEALAIKAQNTNIFARFNPHQKERIINVLRKSGKIVGYLGDGINDAPSLKAADVGISVNNAVDVAKETADIILMQKGLKELMDGVIEGRKTFGNTTKYILMGLSSNFGNMFSMIGAALYLPFFPMLPGQILLNNFLYDISQVFIPTDKVDQEYLKKPKHWDIGYIKKFMIVFGPISTIFDFLTFFLLYKVFSLADSHFQTGWFIESLATQVLVIYIIRTKKLPFLQSAPSKFLVMSTLSIVGIGIIIAMTKIGSYFGFTPLPPMIIIAMFALVALYLIIVEIAKQIFYKRYKNEMV